MERPTLENWCWTLSKDSVSVYNDNGASVIQYHGVLNGCGADVVL